MALRSRQRIDALGSRKRERSGPGLGLGLVSRIRRIYINSLIGCFKLVDWLVRVRVS